MTESLIEKMFQNNLFSRCTSIISTSLRYTNEKALVANRICNLRVLEYALGSDPRLFPIFFTSLNPYWTGGFSPTRSKTEESLRDSEASISDAFVTTRASTCFRASDAFNQVLDINLLEKISLCPLKLNSNFELKFLVSLKLKFSFKVASKKYFQGTTFKLLQLGMHVNQFVVIIGDHMFLNFDHGVHSFSF